ncbi:hypothetical protein SLE2022_335190 [Rubroshorea leprosula]
MEEYLNYMKTLRSQMSDVEDQAAKISVEEQMHIVTIQTMENDLNSAKSETKQLKDDAEQMMTLELIQQERVSLSAKLKDKRAYYSKVAEDISHKLQEQQVNNKHDGKMTGTKGMASRLSSNKFLD